MFFVSSPEMRRQQAHLDDVVGEFEQIMSNEGVVEALGASAVVLSQLGDGLYVPNISKSGVVTASARKARSDAIPALTLDEDNNLQIDPALYLHNTTQKRQVRADYPRRQHPVLRALVASKMFMQHDYPRVLFNYGEPLAALSGITHDMSYMAIQVQPRPWLIMNGQSMSTLEPVDRGLVVVHELHHAAQCYERPIVSTSNAEAHRVVSEIDAYRVQALAQRGLGLRPGTSSLTVSQDQAFVVERLSSDLDIEHPGNARAIIKLYGFAMLGITAPR